MRVLPRCGAAEATLGVVDTSDGNERPAAGPERGPLLPLDAGGQSAERAWGLASSDSRADAAADQAPARFTMRQALQAAAPRPPVEHGRSAGQQPPAGDHTIVHGLQPGEWAAHAAASRAPVEDAFTAAVIAQAKERRAEEQRLERVLTFDDPGCDGSEPEALPAPRAKRARSSAPKRVRWADAQPAPQENGGGRSTGRHPVGSLQRPTRLLCAIRIPLWSSYRGERVQPAYDLCDSVPQALSPHTVI